MRQELARLGLQDLVRGIGAGRFRAEDYARVCLAAIQNSESRIQAWAFLDPLLALRQAKSIDDRRHLGLPLGVLGGVPVGVKDIVATVQMPTQMGSPIFSGHQPRQPADIVTRLETAGAYVLGKTVTTEFAYLSPAKTRNPWQLEHTPGGSSSGSAAAVAAGHVPAALGTQTNGSVIRPAAFCGVVGFKPSKEVLPYHGVLQLAPSLDQMGMFAHRIADVTLLTRALAGTSMPVADALADLPHPPLLLLLGDPPWIRADQATQLALDNVAFLLGQAGARVVRIAYPQALADVAATHRRILLFEAFRALGEVQERERERISALFNATLDEGRNVTEADYRDALERRQEIITQFEKLTIHADAVLLPPAPGVAPQGLGSTGDPGFCTLFSLTGMPALSLPIGLSASGLPVGLQLGACRGQDMRLLAVASWIEGKLGFSARPNLLSTR